MKIPVGLILGGIFTQSLFALDFNAVYPRTPAQPNGIGFYAGLAEQDTYFNDTQFNGLRAITPHGQQVSPGSQSMTTITSEPYLGYNFCDRFGLQLELPVIYREGELFFPGNVLNSSGKLPFSEYGMGDIRLLGNVGLIHHNQPGWAANWNLTGGIKFPTGDSSSLSKTNINLGIGNQNDLALGSGSYDGLVGTDILLRRRNLFLSGETQYAIRSEGAADYTFANDLSWYGGPGIYLLDKDDYSLSLQVLASGDTKDKDTGPAVSRRLRGSRTAFGTDETSVFLGPQINFTWRDRVTAQLAADLPVAMETSFIEEVPTYRIQAAVTVRF